MATSADPVGSHIPAPFPAEGDTEPSQLCAVWDTALGWGSAWLLSDHTMICIWSPIGCFTGWASYCCENRWKQSFSNSLKIWRCEIRFVPKGTADLLVFVGILACMQKGNYVNHIPRNASDIILRGNNIRHYEFVCRHLNNRSCFKRIMCCKTTGFQQIYFLGQSCGIK